MVRNLMDQVQVAVLGREGGARCQVQGYARPRRYDLLGQDRKPSKATQPSIVMGKSSAMITWADARDGKRRAYAVPLDDALRNKKLPGSITPEGHRAMTPMLLPVDDRYLASYWDEALGVNVRWLDSDGVIAEAPIAITDRTPGAYFAHASLAGSGFAVAYADRKEADSVDLFYRMLDKEGIPVAEAVRVTDYINQGPLPSRVRDVQVAVVGDKIHFAYTYVLGALQQIRYQVVPTDTAAPGLEAPEGPLEERTLGIMVAITQGAEKSEDPTLSCFSEGCYVAWTRRTGGAGVAFVDQEAKVQWHNLFAPNGKKASIALAESGEAQVVWVEGGRIVTGSLGRSGVGPSSKVARVVGDHPPPTLTPGAKKGEWYIAWLDYEAGHQEPYALRMECQ
jgi:serine/threonine-protein kinase